MNRKPKYKTKTIKVTPFTGQSKVNRLIAAGWEVVSTTRYGWNVDRVTLRIEK